jgi:hypothetical protein
LTLDPGTGDPGDLGFDADRLERIGDAVGRYIESGEVAGAVTLVARHGRIVHLQAHGSGLVSGAAFENAVRQALVD